MKILHLVTLVSRDGAYGGPLRVALNQASELRARGHDVHLAAAWRGEWPPPQAVEKVPAHLFKARSLVPAKGFSGLVSPGLVRWLSRHVSGYDVVHVHAGRDLVSLGSLAVARLRTRPYVTQTHGMVQPDSRVPTRVIDLVLARRLLRSARTRFVLTEAEEIGLAEVLGGAASLERLVNGVPEVGARPASASREVLFCARMQQRKRPVSFVEVADRLHQRGVLATFALVGPDEGELAAVQHSITDRGLSSIVRYEGALDYGEVLARMSRTGVYVLPSVHEPFPMSLLEALSLGVPSVCTDTCGVAAVLRDAGAAIVTDGSIEAMANAVESILENSSVRSALSSSARQVVHEQFSMRAVGDQLELAYRAAANGPPAATARSGRRRALPGLTSPKL